MDQSHKDCNGSDKARTPILEAQEFTLEAIAPEQAAVSEPVAIQSVVKQPVANQLPASQAMPRQVMPRQEPREPQPRHLACTLAGQPKRPWLTNRR